MGESQPTTVTIGRSSASPAITWNAYAMNGMPSAAIALPLPKAVDVTVSEETLTVDLDDGRTISVPIVWYPRLAHGTPAERANFQIAGAGYGIHWPDLDEDIGVEGLVLGKRSTESPNSFERWLRRRRLAGQGGPAAQAKR